MGREFTIHADTGFPTPDSAYHPSFDNALKAVQISAPLPEDEFLTEGEGDQDEDSEEDGVNARQDTEDDDADRRQSIATSTSVSSMPESHYPSEVERVSPTRAPYTPSRIRPSFRATSSVRRMQMASPPPFESYSPRYPVLRGSRSGTPRSARAQAHGSRSPSKRERVAEEQSDLREFPLVLLHITLLPIRLPWSAESMQELLPAHVLESLKLLRTTASETVVQRGILMPHPRENYDLLEERLLEALELREERVTKCGHYRRVSDQSDSSLGGSDSGLGSSVEGLPLDREQCQTCHFGIKMARSGAGEGVKRWSIKIFAANGLMRANAWAAAWSEMERIDVEIVPWISECLQRKLDERREEEEVEAKMRDEDEGERIKELVEEQVRLAVEERRQAEDGRRYRLEQQTAVETVEQLPPSASRPQPAASVSRPRSRAKEDEPRERKVEDLPEIYKPKDIPLAVLLSNYVYVLAQDHKNVAIFLLGLFALVFVAGPSSRPAVPGLNAGAIVCPEHAQVVPNWPVSTMNEAMTQNMALVECQLNGTSVGPMEPSPPSRADGQTATGAQSAIGEAGPLQEHSPSPKAASTGEGEPVFPSAKLHPSHGDLESEIESRDTLGASTSMFDELAEMAAEAEF